MMDHLLRVHGRAAGMAASLTLAFGASVGADLTLATLLRSGEPAPVGEPGVVFSGFIGAPALAASTGELLVRARLSGPTVNNTSDVGLFLVSPEGEVMLLAREGDMAAGLTPNLRYANLDTTFLPAFNAAGEVVFPAILAGGGFVDGQDLGLLLSAWGACSGPCQADLNGDSVVDGADLGIILSNWGVCDSFCQADLTNDAVFTTNDLAVFAGRPDNVRPLLREGGAAPGLNAKILGFSQGLINNGGTIGVRATIQFPPAPNGSGRVGFATWLYDGGLPILVAASERQAPGFDPGLAFSSVGGLSVNSSDEHAFISGVFHPVTGVSEGAGVWTGSFDALELIASSDEPAPGTDPVVFFRTFNGIPLKGSHGDVIFVSALKGPSIVFGNDFGLWRHAGGVTTKVARLGDPAPEAGPGAIFDALETPIGDSSRTCVFRAEFIGEGITTTNDEAIIAVDADNSRRIVARTGDQAPGAPEGQVWFSFPLPPTINANGRAAFEAILTGPGVSSANRDGVWLIEETGQTTLVVRQGDIVEVAPGDSRQIFQLSALLSTSVDTGEPRGIDDADDLVLTLTFTDLSSAIVRATVPAPTPGDLNDDGAVDGADLGALLAAWGPCAGACAADLNADGVVDGADLGLLLGLWTSA